MTKIENESNAFILDDMEDISLDQYLELIESLPGMFHVNRAGDFAVLHSNKKLQDRVGLTSDEIRERGAEFIQSIIHPETLEIEVPKLMDFYSKTDGTESYSFFQKVKYPGDSEYTTLFTVTKAIPKSGVFVTISNEVASMGETSHKFERVIAQQSFLRQNLDRYRNITPREIEVLTLLAKGQNNPDIAKELKISRRTVEQHRRTINKKLNIGNSADLYTFAQAFDLI